MFLATTVSGAKRTPVTWQRLGQDRWSLKRTPSVNWQQYLVRVARAGGQGHELGQDQHTMRQGLQLGQDIGTLKRSTPVKWQQHLVRMVRADGQGQEPGQDRWALKRSPFLNWLHQLVRVARVARVASEGRQWQEQQHLVEQD